MQGTVVWALVQEDPTCCRATKPVRHNYWACALEAVSHNYWSPCTTTTEAHMPRAHAPQQEKPPQWEARAQQQRVAPARCNYRKPARSNEDPTQPKKINTILLTVYKGSISSSSSPKLVLVIYVFIHTYIYVYVYIYIIYYIYNIYIYI